MKNQAKNLKSSYWSTVHGVAGFQTQRAYGIVNHAGTHALFNAQTKNPCTWGTMRTVKEIAPHAEALANNGHHYWGRIYSSRQEVPRT